MRRIVSLLASLTLAGGLLAAPAVGGGGAANAASSFPDCAAPSAAPTIVVGQVSCLLLDSAAVGGQIPFSYYVPPACDPALHRRCPILYLLHGFGGDYQSMLGTAAAPSSWVKALTAGPPVDPHSVPDPWDYGPGTWVPKPSLDVILVAPHGRTVPGGFGPAAGLDSFWADWNPRYAAGGDSPRYSTPPPRFETFLTGELVPFVHGHFPTGAGRSWRALAGTSLGGYGSYKNGLQHPDLWSSLGSVSGAHNFLFAPGLDPGPAGSTAGVQPPAPVPYVNPPGPASAVPVTALPAQAQGFGVALTALGDPAVDQAYYRGNMPRDLAMNARAWSGPLRSLYIKGFNNDAVPRRPQDLQDPGAQAFEIIVVPMNADMEAAFANEGVANDYETHPGIHSGTYWDPFLRGQLEAQYARLLHRNGGHSLPAPSAFDYRSIRTDFSIWDWHFHVDRQPVEFLELRSVSCSGLSLQGTGTVAITAPARCHTGLHGKRTFTVDLGPPMPTNEPAGLGATPYYGRTLTVALTRH